MVRFIQCTKCNSKDIELEEDVTIGFRKIADKATCRNCGNTGYFHEREELDCEECTKNKSECPSCPNYGEWD
ncbi:hypothetical protein PBV87_15380 [Niameybacter massiliensis]|uniref:Uncharacterized protein n=1 Tax=Holtiella tumoricola TaxID=3018743 RepID=A0AA42J268_9FIRM|nr:hypothetical protein [Holtiella tumoricola]MDA3732858.1 hypothetical protein [Holtiella tumoricola]